MKKRKERQSNIELLRILAIAGVIVGHYNNPLYGGALAFVSEGSVNFYVLYLVGSVICCVVNLFVLISGYYLCESQKRNIWRPIELLVQVGLFREAIFLAKVALHVVPFSLKTMISSLLPMNYFAILYCAVYLVSPWFDLLIEKLSEKSFRALVVTMLLVFSVYPTLVDILGEMRGEQFIGLSSVGAYGSQWGYSFINFFMMYVVGSYLRKGNAKVLHWKSRRLVFALIIDVLLILVWARVNDRVGYLAERTAWEYCNPLVIFAAAIIFILFTRIDLGVNKIINKLAEGTFTAFLLHQVFLPYLMIERFATGNPLLMVAHMLLSVAAIYLVSWLVHFIYHSVVDPVFGKLSMAIRLPVIDAES